MSNEQPEKIGRWDIVKTYLAPIIHFFEDPEITEIMINGPHEVFIERRGEKILTKVKFRDNQAIKTCITQIANATDQSCDQDNNPILDARLENGSRVCGVLSPVSSHGHTLTIRLFPKNSWSAKDLVNMGSLTQDMMDFLNLAVLLKRNILLSGSTGSGKTTFLNVLANAIPSEDRVVTVEDTEELKIPNTNWVSLVAPRRRQAAHSQALTLGNLIRTTLRLNPDRIIVGEIRDAEAAQAFLQAINTGHNGSCSTVHANDPELALVRLQNLLGSSGLSLPFVESQVRSNLHLVVQVAKVVGVGRRVVAISELRPSGDMVPLWIYDLPQNTHHSFPDHLSTSPVLTTATELGLPRPF